MSHTKRHKLFSYKTHLKGYSILENYTILIVSLHSYLKARLNMNASYP